MSSETFVERPQLSDDVARNVRTRIFSGELKAGEYLRLDQLATALGTSVTPVREAMLALRGEGLVDQLPRRGFVVLPLSRQDIVDVSEVQAHIGGELAARAAGIVGPAQIAELRRIEEDLERAHARGDRDAAVHLNHALHRAINLAASSRKLAQIMSSITRYAPESVFPQVEGWPAKAMADHRRIIDALENGDADEARAAMAEHFSTGVDQMMDHLTAVGVLTDD